IALLGMVARQLRRGEAAPRGIRSLRRVHFKCGLYRLGPPCWPSWPLIFQPIDALGSYALILMTMPSFGGLPSSQGIARLRDRRIHDVLVDTGVGCQLHYVAVRIAHVDGPDEPMIDRPPHLDLL